FFFKQKTAYEIETWLECRRVLFRSQTLEKEIDFLEKNLAVKKDEWTAYSDKVKSDLEVPAKRHMKNVEVPTGEKSMFGLGKEIMKTEKKPTKNVVISE